MSSHERFYYHFHKMSSHKNDTCVAFPCGELFSHA